jgi:hypothetical protein
MECGGGVGDSGGGLAEEGDFGRAGVFNLEHHHVLTMKHK